jgi:hypothetical protein
MNAWLWALSASVLYLAGWWITPFLLVEFDRKYPEKKIKNNPGKIREDLHKNVIIYPAFSLVWPVFWLIMGGIAAFHLHEGALRKRIDRPFSEEAEELAAQEKRRRDAHVQAMEKANGIGEA